jgi:hypothetical protein
LGAAATQRLDENRDHCCGSNPFACPPFARRASPRSSPTQFIREIETDELSPISGLPEVGLLVRDLAGRRARAGDGVFVAPHYEFPLFTDYIINKNAAKQHSLQSKTASRKVRKAVASKH